MDDSVLICDEVIKSYDEEIKTIPTNLNVKLEVSVFYLPFY